MNCPCAHRICASLYCTVSHSIRLTTVLLLCVSSSLPACSPVSCIASSSVSFGREWPSFQLVRILRSRVATVSRHRSSSSLPSVESGNCIKAAFQLVRTFGREWQLYQGSVPARPYPSVESGNCIKAAFQLVRTFGREWQLYQGSVPARPYLRSRVAHRSSSSVSSVCN